MATHLLVTHALLAVHALNGAVPADGSSISHLLFHFDVPAWEKVVRTIAVYLGIAILVRLAGKREMAQLNSFDLVVVMLLSNVVQNAVIGPDNSIAGGLLGAVVLVVFNAAWERLALVSSTLTRIFEGSSTLLVSGGKLDQSAIRREGLYDAEVVSAVRHQGANSIQDVDTARLEPGGSITVELLADAQNATSGELRAAIAELREHLDRRLDALPGTAH